MKYRLAALVVFLALTQASCSLSEDITPPPGYQSPTSVPNLAPATQTPKPNWTTEPDTITPESSSPGTQSTTPSDDIKVTPRVSFRKISGNLVNGSGGGIPDGQKVTLVGFDKDQSGNYQKVTELEAPVESDGSFNFKDPEAPLDRAYLIISSWGGVEYQSDPVLVTDSTTDYSIPITIYEKTDDPNILAFNQVHLKFDLPSQDIIQVTELFIVTNPGKQVVVVPSDGTTIPFIHTPDTAGSVQYQLSQGSAQLLNATGGFALLPGTDKQYGFIASFTMPYRSSLKFDQPFSIPVSSLTVFVPQGMRFRSDQLIDAGPQDIQGQSYQIYQANNLASGSSLSLTLSAKPGASARLKFDRQTMVLIGIGVVGVLLIGIGITLFLRDRARFKKENEYEAEHIEEDALGEDRNHIMDAMIALDDQFKTGAIPIEAYEKRRLELKERLKEAL
jgi:hypothetical protein